MIKKRVLSVLLVLAMVLGMIPAVASAETETPEITSAQLVLDSILGINLKVDLKGNPVADYTVEVTIGDAVQKLTGSADGVYTAKLMAHQMTDTIHIALKQGNTMLQEKDWSVKTNYVDVIAADPTASAETKALVTAMYNYGLYAAYYKNGGTDPAVSAVETAEAVAEAHKMSLTSTVTLGAVAYLYLDESCDLCFKFNEEPMSGKTLWVDGAQVTPTDIGTQVQYKIKDILPQNYGTKHSVQVKDSENKVVFDLSYSVLSYMYQCQNKTGEDYDSLNKLMKAMRLYGQAAESYQKTLPTYLTEANAGTPALFAATINANPAGNYALKEDLDWSGESASGISTFSGVLDGQGYSIKGAIPAVVAISEEDRDKAEEAEYQNCLFGVNTGTIKNLAIEFYVAEGAGNSTSLVAKNHGTVENLFVEAAFAGYSYTTGAIVAINLSSGTVKNCITTVSSTMSTQDSKNRLGSIVGVDKNGKILNCYAVNTANSITTPYIDTWNNGNYTGSAVYANNQLLLSGINTSAEPFAGANGWSRFWKMTANGIAFGDKLVIGGAVCVHKDEKPVDGKCDNCGTALTLPAGVVLLNETNAGTPLDFVQLVSQNPGYTYYLTEDLDWTGETGAGIAAFSGILDGQGHSIKGLVNGLVLVKNDQGNDDYTKSLIGVNTGTIKNLSIDYSITVAAGSFYGLIYKNEGTVENLFVKASFDVAAVASGAVANINTATGTIKNCIVNVSTADTSNKDKIGPVVYAERNGKILNCHVVNTANSVTITHIKDASFNSGAYSGNGVYANDQALLDALTAMPGADGWSDYWAITTEGITFGGKVVIAGAATKPCTHEDKSPVDGKCDLCGEAVERTDVHLLNMTTVPTIADLVTAINNDLDGDFYLTEDLNYTGSAENTNGIGAFTGTLNGQGHTIKGITIKYNSQNKDNATSFFDSNAGTIENISFEYNINFLNGGPYGLITTNTGVIQNVYAKATLASINTSWYGSAFVGDNSGSAKINNCIVDVAIDGSVINAGDQFGIIVGISRGGTTVQNCYYTYTATEGLTVPTFSNATATWGSTITNVAALDANATVNAADGWADCWSVELKGEEYGIWFGDTLVLAMTKPCVHKDTSYVDGLCDLCGEAVALPEGTYLINSTTAGTKANLVALINADPDGKFYVTEDLDYSSEDANDAGIGTFAGLLDGQGHTIKGITVRYNSSDTVNYPRNLILSNQGTIQNIGLGYTITDAQSLGYGLIKENLGTIKNVYAMATINAVKTDTWGTAFVGLNGNGTDNGVIENCIVDVTVASSITSVGTMFGAVAAINYSGSTVDKCYYKVTAAATVTVPGIASQRSTVNNTALLSKDTALDLTDGWSSCWTVELTGIYFSGTLVQELTPPCSHVDTAYVDGKCDLCDEAVALPEGTYLINSTTAATEAALAELINKDLNGHYYVTEDIIYSTNSNTGIGAFAGLLDGQGHSLKGIVIDLNSQDEWYSNLFKTNSGTIQNIALEYTIKNENGSNNGLVGINTGTIQNVYAKATIQDTFKADHYSGALVGINGGAGTIKNCVVDVTVALTSGSLHSSIGVFASQNNAEGGIANCYYRVSGADMSAIARGYAGNAVSALSSSVTALLASNGWSSYWTATPSGIWFSDTQIMAHEGNADDAIIVLEGYEVTNISSETTIAHQSGSEDKRANIFAWYDFEKLYEEITGTNITVHFVSDLNSLPTITGNYFILGGTLAELANLGYVGITTDNGHKIVKADNKVYLYGQSGYGTANAMYAFLKQAFGVEFYSDTVYTTTDNAYTIDEISDVTFNPSVDYNWAYDGLLYRDNGNAINYAYQMRMGFVNYWQLQAGSFHAFSSEALNELNSNFTSNGTTNVDLNAAGEINTSNAMVIAVADYVYEEATRTERPIVAVGPADTHDWCTNSGSRQHLEYYGAYSGEYLLFMNAVIELLNTDSKYSDLSDVEVVMLSYNGSLAAPTLHTDELKPNTNNDRGISLKLMFAPLEMNINGEPTDSTTKDYYGNTPSYYYGEYAKWQEIFGEENVYVWRYSTIFNNYMIPVNTIEYIQDNYQALAGSDNSIKHLMDQGTGKSPVQTNFQALLVYLKGQLGKNVNADLDTLITNFCNAYYGEAAGTYIKQLLEAEQSHLNTMSDKMNTTKTNANGTKVDNSGCHSMPEVSAIWGSTMAHDIFAEKWWSANCSDDNGAMLKTWYGYITNALDATTDAEQQARIRVEAIALRYISLKTHGVALVSGDTLAKVQTDASALGITRFSEGADISYLSK